MKPNSKIILSSILGLSLSAQAQNVQIGIPLIKREDLQRISEENDFPEMEKALLESGIIQEVKLREYYLVYPSKLNQQSNWAYSEKDAYILNILNSIKRQRILIEFKAYSKMMSTSQDFSPYVKIDQIKLNDRFQRGRP